MEICFTLPAINSYRDRFIYASRAFRPPVFISDAKLSKPIIATFHIKFREDYYCLTTAIDATPLPELGLVKVELI